MHLRHATERIGILDTAAIDVALHDLTVLQEVQQALRDQPVSRERAQPVEALVKRSLRAGQRFEAHGADDVRGLEAIVEPFYRLNCKRKDELSAVDQRKPFFGSERQRRQPETFQHMAGRLPLPAMIYFP